MVERDVVLVNRRSGIAALVARFTVSVASVRAVPSHVEVVQFDIVGGLTLMPSYPVAGERLAKACDVYTDICELGTVQWLNPAVITHVPADITAPAIPPVVDRAEVAKAFDDAIIRAAGRSNLQQDQMIVMVALFNMLGGGEITLDWADLVVAREMMEKGATLEIARFGDPAQVRVKLRKMGQ
jgi:hypothetical protein